MSGRDPWSDFEGGPAAEASEDDTATLPPLPAEATTETPADEALDVLDVLAGQLDEIERTIEFHKEERRRCAREILTRAEGLIVPVETEEWRISIRRTERWSWDKVKLAQILVELGQEDADLPAFVERRTSIDREQFELAAPTQREAFEPALHRGRGPVHIEVTRKAD